ncbi:MAG: hypothetical protein HY075_08850 [Deltaproteobacteria bacterium]|nr:hypothetical protein [Deltaproteobacteria bacterium]
MKYLLLTGLLLTSSVASAKTVSHCGAYNDEGGVRQSAEVFITLNGAKLAARYEFNDPLATDPTTRHMVFDSLSVKLRTELRKDMSPRTLADLRELAELAKIDFARMDRMELYDVEYERGAISRDFRFLDGAGVLYAELGILGENLLLPTCETIR